MGREGHAGLDAAVQGGHLSGAGTPHTGRHRGVSESRRDVGGAAVREGRRRAGQRLPAPRRPAEQAHRRDPQGGQPDLLPAPRPPHGGGAGEDAGLFPRPHDRGVGDAAAGEEGGEEGRAGGRAMKRGRMPKLVEALRGYNLKTFLADLIAGVTVGLVALPLAMAFAISSGVPPQAGLYCAVVAGFLISALGGSRTQVGGPTGAFVVIVFGIVARHGLDGLLMCTIMAGVLLIVLGATGMGTAVDFIPRPVIVGFTNGIAVLIASTQIKDLLGLDIPQVSGAFVPRMIQILRALPTFSLATFGLAAVALIVVVTGNRFVRRVPGTILALFAGTVAAVLLQLPVETIGSRFGGVPAGLPPFSPPRFRPELIQPLLTPALTVAMLGAIESLMSAVVADR